MILKPVQLTVTSNLLQVTLATVQRELSRHKRQQFATILVMTVNVINLTRASQDMIREGNQNSRQVDSQPLEIRTRAHITAQALDRDIIPRFRDEPEMSSHKSWHQQILKVP